MELNSKVLVLPNICGIEIDLTGEATPSVDPSLQPFYNSIIQNSTAQPVYFSPSKGHFSESGKQTRAGYEYEQKLRLQFPSNDPVRAKRFEAYIKVKYIYITLSNGMIFLFGRNDYFQNSAPKIDIVNTEKLTQITYSTKSMFASGFTNGSFDFNVPQDFPINFFNLL